MSDGASSYLAEQPRRLARWFRGGLRPDQVSPLDLLIIQGTRFCNLDCSYCYLPFRAQKGRIDLDLVERAFVKFMDAGLVPPNLSVAWHAGEPLVLPLDFYEEAFARIGRIVGDEIKVSHHFQTNATLVTEEVCLFIKRHDVQIGVSLDGPEHLHDARRRQRNGSGSFAATMTGVELLRKHGIRHSVICVLTDESLRQPDAIYEFFRDIGCHNVGFNVEEVEGYNKRSSLGAESILQYKMFLRYLWTRVRSEHNLMKIREIDFTQGLIQYSLSGMPTTSSESEPFGNVGLDVDGNLYTFSPELIDIKGPDGGSLSLGHIDAIDFDTINEDPRFLAIAGPIAAGVELCRKTCGYFDSCGGGAPANRLAENGTFVSTETLHCRLTRQVPVEVVEEDLLEQIRTRQEKRARPVTVPRPSPTRPVASAATGATAGTADNPLALGLPLLADSQLGDLLEISAGTTLARPVAGAILQAGAIEPRAPWRRPSAAELTLLRKAQDASRPYDYVALVRMADEHVEGLRDLADRHGGRCEPTEPALAALAEPIARLLGDYSGKQLPLGIERRRGGHRIATQQAGTGELIGLHVDSWSNRGLNERSDVGNRICINLGDQPRRLLFVNAPISRIAATVRKIDGEQPERRDPTDIARRFLALFPSFPVLRLTVPPGHAYVAPTEILIHDGDTEGVVIDRHATILGRFPAFAVKDRVADPELPVGKVAARA